MVCACIGIELARGFGWIDATEMWPRGVGLILFILGIVIVSVGAQIRYRRDTYQHLVERKRRLDDQARETIS